MIYRLASSRHVCNLLISPPPYFSFQDVMFSDFFKPPPKPFYTRGDRSNDRPKSAPKKKTKAVDFMDDEEEEDDKGSDLEEDEDIEDEEDDIKVKSLFEEDEEDEEQGSKSAHEKRLERIKEQIDELEMQNVGVKDWTLGGEVMFTFEGEPNNFFTFNWQWLFFFFR